MLTQLSKMNSSNNITSSKISQIRPQTAIKDQLPTSTKAAKTNLLPYQSVKIPNQYSMIKSLKQPPKKTMAKKPKKTDPVSLYQNMQNQWQKQKQKQKQRATMKNVQVP